MIDFVSARIRGNTAALTIDLEYDYGGHGTASMLRFEEIVTFASDHNVAMTVFVEGRVLQNHDGICDVLKSPFLDPAQHCLDHRKPGDTKEDIRQGRDIFANIFGTAPAGYRAHTFQFNRDLLNWLFALGYSWDSSFLPARFGFGAGKDTHILNIVAQGNKGCICVKADDNRKIVEIPVGVLGKMRIPFIQSYQLLAGRTASRLLRQMLGLPTLFVHDMHMVDLFENTKSLDNCGLTPTTKNLFRASWIGKPADSLHILSDFIQGTQHSGYEWKTLSAIADDMLQSQ